MFSVKFKMAFSVLIPSTHPSTSTQPRVLLCMCSISNVNCHHSMVNVMYETIDHRSCRRRRGIVVHILNCGHCDNFKLTQKSILINFAQQELREFWLMFDSNGMTAFENMKLNSIALMKSVLPNSDTHVHVESGGERETEKR